MNKLLVVFFSVFLSVSVNAEMNAHNSMGMMIRFKQLCGETGKFYKIKAKELENKIKYDGFDVDKEINENITEVNYGYGLLEGGYLYGTLVSDRPRSEVCELIDSAYFG